MEDQNKNIQEIVDELFERTDTEFHAFLARIALSVTLSDDSELA